MRKQITALFLALCLLLSLLPVSAFAEAAEATEVEAADFMITRYP